MDLNKEYRRCYKAWKKDFYIKPFKERRELSEYTRGLIFIAFEFFGALCFIGCFIGSIILACIYPALIPAFIVICIVSVAIAYWVVKDAILRLRDEYGYF